MQLHGAAPRWTGAIRPVTQYSLAQLRGGSGISGFSTCSKANAISSSLFPSHLLGRPLSCYSMVQHVQKVNQPTRTTSEQDFYSCHSGGESIPHLTHFQAVYHSCDRVQQHALQSIFIFLTSLSNPQSGSWRSCWSLLSPFLYSILFLEESHSSCSVAYRTPYLSLRCSVSF